MYFQLVREEYKIKLENLQNLMSEKDSILPTNLDDITKEIVVFVSVIEASLPDLKLEDDKTVLKHLKNLEDGKLNYCFFCNLLFF